MLHMFESPMLKMPNERLNPNISPVLKMNERLTLISTLKKYGVILRLMKEFEPQCLLTLCGRLEEKQTPQPWYTNSDLIQKELLKDERFFFYLGQMMGIEGNSTDFIERLLKTIHANGETVYDYPADNLIESMALAAENASKNYVFYDYLKNFSSLKLAPATAKVIFTNLEMYGTSLSKPVSELAAKEKELHKEKALNNRRLMPDKDDIDRAFNLLAQHDGLLEVIRFLNEYEFGVSLSLEHYEAICQNPEEVRDMLKAFRGLLGDEIMQGFLDRWVENKCTHQDLEFLGSRINNMPEAERAEIFANRSSYINFIYGNRFKDIRLSETPHYIEEILIYAITHKKAGFIRLIEENFELLSAIGYNSVLFKREFYVKHININTLNANNLRDCVWMKAQNVWFDYLEDGRTYTFAEIKALYDLPPRYYALYNRLAIIGIDERLVCFKQLTKRKLLNVVTDNAHIEILAQMFSQKPLSAWIEQHFSHITGLQPHDVILLLVHRDSIQHLIPQMTVKADALLVARNPESAKNYATLDEMKADLIRVDTAWGNLINDLGFTDEFLQQHKERVVEFLSKNGADIAHTYHKGIDGDGKRESFKRIIKAVLMGEFGKLKYYADDLCKEIEYPITRSQKTIWMENSEAAGKSGIKVSECDDFYSTMLLGTTPLRTCLSYIDGDYKECLMSGFDSNKKVLYAYKDGETVGRAIVRLTKGSFNNPAKQVEASLSFVDVETVNEQVSPKSNENNGEQLILFLERPFSARISDTTAASIQKMYVELMSKKADAMGALLVISNSYAKSLPKDFIHTTFHVFISKSKAGAQYLDSLNGSATVSDEGGYKYNSFYIHKNMVA